MEEAVRKLINWYKKHGRDLPWRHQKDPYIIWVSEIILQQTRVSQGLPYFNRFITEFPDILSLKKASKDNLLKVWQGLGYYSRALNMHKTACLIVEKYGGNFPAEYQELIQLPGVGRYTAAAIASFAFDKPVAVRDGNVNRILTRVFAISDDINKRHTIQNLEEILSGWLPDKHASVFNQAMMDLGAIVCTPSGYDCLQCPLNEHCIAFFNNEVSLYPVKVKKGLIKHRYFNYLLLETHRGILMRQRDNTDIWKNLYDLPCIESYQELNEAEFIQALEKSEWRNIISERPKLVYKAEHILTHRKIFACFRMYSFEVEKKSIPAGIFETPIGEIDKFPVSRLFSRFMAYYINHINE